jgi:hypothetical protein
LDEVLFAVCQRACKVVTVVAFAAQPVCAIATHYVIADALVQQPEVYSTVIYIGAILCFCWTFVHQHCRKLETPQS